MAKQKHDLAHYEETIKKLKNNNQLDELIPTKGTSQLFSDLVTDLTLEELNTIKIGDTGTLLQCAIQVGNITAIKALVQEGVNVNKSNSYNPYKPLGGVFFVAGSFNFHPNILPKLKILLEAGSDVEQSIWQGSQRYESFMYSLIHTQFTSHAEGSYDMTLVVDFIQNLNVDEKTLDAMLAQNEYLYNKDKPDFLSDQEYKDNINKVSEVLKERGADITRHQERIKQHNLNRATDKLNGIKDDINLAKITSYDTKDLFKRLFDKVGGIEKIEELSGKEFNEVVVELIIKNLLNDFVSLSSEEIQNIANSVDINDEAAKLCVAIKKDLIRAHKECKNDDLDQILDHSRIISGEKEGMLERIGNYISTMINKVVSMIKGVDPKEKPMLIEEANEALFSSSKSLKVEGKFTQKIIEELNAQKTDDKGRG